MVQPVSIKAHADVVQMSVYLLLLFSLLSYGTVFALEFVSSSLWMTVEFLYTFIRLLILWSVFNDGVSELSFVTL